MSRGKKDAILKDSYHQIIENFYGMLSTKIIAFRREFVDVAGSVAGALFLSQSLYWMPKSQDSGWFYKTGEEWAAETGLTRREQEAARRMLKKNGILEEQKKGVPCRLYFRIDIEQLARLLGSCTRELPYPIKGPSSLYDCTNKFAGNVQASLAETTNYIRKQEITTESTTGEIAPALFDLGKPDREADITNLSEWKEFVEMRRKTGHPLVTDGAKSRLIGKLRKFQSQGYDIQAILQKSCDRSWRDVFEPKQEQRSAVTLPEPDALEVMRAKEKARYANGH